MTLRQTIFAFIIAIFFLVIIFDLIRRRKLKEEYSWMWLLVGAIMLVLAGSYDFLLYVTNLIGSEDSATTIFLFGFLFLVLVNLHYSIKISVFTNQIKKLTQNIGIMEKEVEDIKNKK